MPHLVLEYTANVPDRPDLGRVLLDLHEALLSAAPFERKDLKSRAVRHDVFAVADGAEDRSFVALSIAILEGRPDEVKATLSEAALDVLVRAYPKLVAGGRGAISIEVRDLHRASYRRVRIREE
ncbi:MAG: 5-carboxymethyl-2-hydroxymuconate Delta-isomerase [Thermoanaerobaculia bacterium]